MIEVFISLARRQETLRWEGSDKDGRSVSAIDEWLEDRSIKVCKRLEDQVVAKEVFGITYSGKVWVGWMYAFEDSQQDLAMLFKLTWS